MSILHSFWTAYRLNYAVVSLLYFSRQTMAGAEDIGFLYDRNSDLLDGTFIAAGLFGIRNLAAFLEENPTVVPVHVLLSDTSLAEIESDFGYLPLPPLPPNSQESWCIDYDYRFDYPSTPGRLDIDVPDEEEDILSHNRKLRRRIGRAVRDLPDSIQRILDRISPTVETFSFLLYVSPVYEHELGGGSLDWNRLFFNECQEVGGSPSQRYRFPRLKALTLRNSVRLNKMRIFDDVDLLSGHPLFPSVTHLHFIHERHISPSFEELHILMPSLTHVRFTGTKPRLRSEQLPYPDPAGLRNWLPQYWYDGILNGLSVSLPERMSLVPENLTVIIHPDFDTMLDGDYGCEREEYDSELRELHEMQDVHLSWPIEEDFRRFSSVYRLFPVDRAIENFKAFAAGGEGDWAIPDVSEADKPIKEWWWNARRLSFPRRPISEVAI
ncbi:hypothetical protein Moror_1744 [Moniliophthora roreri MCA 2997]|uniref:Uncharacterized protein n=1 Tax=Moniliophthora roreri (strain MCA 2997) TaxID=1381753 RepID=V2X2V6_MONRO|nr:hypothetical protein Moror_1744 [Moniliophthora roreri MCA 2997]